MREVDHAGAPGICVTNGGMNITLATRSRFEQYGRDLGSTGATWAARSRLGRHGRDSSSTVATQAAQSRPAFEQRHELMNVAGPRLGLVDGQSAPGMTVTCFSAHALVSLLPPFDDHELAERRASVGSRGSPAGVGRIAVALVSGHKLSLGTRRACCWPRKSSLHASCGRRENLKRR